MSDDRIEVDLTAQSSILPAMDQDTLDLVDRLCTRASMIIEDVHDAALSIRQAGPSQQLLLLAHLEDAAKRMARLISAARALIGD